MSTDIETKACEDLRYIIDNFNFGHNLIRSPATLEQILSQLVETIKPVVKKYKQSISDINISVYDRDSISYDKANLCWYKLPINRPNKLNSYLILVNPFANSVFVPITSDVLMQLLLNGKTTSGWHLLNQIDCIQDFISNSDTSDSFVNIFFSNILKKVIDIIFNSHSDDLSLHGHYIKQFANTLQTYDDVENVIGQIQIKAEKSKLTDTGSNVTTIYATDNDVFKIYTSGQFKLTELSVANIPLIVNSEYLFKKSDIAAFLENKSKQSAPSNVKFYYVHENFNMPRSSTPPFEFADNMYSITSQLIGTFEVKYTDGTLVKLAPTSQAIPIVKTQNEIVFLIMLQTNTYLSKTIDKINTDNVRLLFTLKGRQQ